MKHKVTREEILKSIIRLINEYREDSVEESARLGNLHIGIQTLTWMYDWLCEDYAKINMQRPSEEELKTLVKGDTIGKLADIAMSHIKGDGEYEVAEEKEKEPTTKKVFIYTSNPSTQDGVAAMFGPDPMRRDEFLKKCGEFYDSRGTHCNDFEVMEVRILG